MTQTARLSSGGVIDRDVTINFRFNGRRFTGHPGDTLASALLANGVRLVARSFKYHRPRGIMAAGADEANALVSLGRGAASTPNLKATEIPLFEGLEAASINCWPSPHLDLRAINQIAAPLFGAGFYYKTFKWPDWQWFEPAIRRAAGLGVVPSGLDPDRYTQAHATCEILVVGAGPAGLRETLRAARRGRSVILIERDFRLGGSALWRQGGSEAAELEEQIRAMPNVKILMSTNVFGYYDHNALAAVEHVAEPQPAQRLWKLRAAKVVLATGATERPMVFANNDRPGVMLASAAQAYALRWGVLPGKRIAVFTNNDGAYEAAEALHGVGAKVTLIDSRSCAAIDAPTGVEFHGAHQVIGVIGGRRVRGVRVRSNSGRETLDIDCDLIAMSGGWSPVVHLFSQSGGSLQYSDEIHAFVPKHATQRVHVIGGAAGEFETKGEPLWEVAGKGHKFVDFANDVTAKDIAIAAEENYVSVEHLKRYTTLGMGVDQGKTSNINGLALMGNYTGRAPGEVGTTKFRPPYSPVTFGALAGPLVGDLYRPIRHLPAHDWHVAHGAVFEEFAAWARPTAYTEGHETWAKAAQREAETARTGVALFDGSPLGKIEVLGPDAGTFLDRIYVGNASSLKIASARYGLMLNENGVIIDDGVFVRLADNHFLVHTTSGGAQRIADLLEEWLQCEWTDLDVIVVPVTTQWATLTLSGPRARLTLERANTDLELDSFRHMTWREGTVAGLPTRVLRASFTGEASYEISIGARCALELAYALEAAGSAYGFTPIGVEALNILRTEKGYLHVGVDTDGTTLPDDVGMAGPVAKKISDFVGRRSLMRVDAQRKDRLQLVGLASGSTVLPVGAHVLRNGQVPGPADGYVTSSYHSPNLGHAVSLAMVRAGRSRMGEKLDLYDMGRRFSATVVDPVFIDKDGERVNA